MKEELYIGGKLQDNSKQLSDSGRSSRNNDLLHDSGRFTESTLGSTASSRLNDDLTLPLNTSRSDPTSSTYCMDTPRYTDNCPSGSQDTPRSGPDEAQERQAELALRKSLVLDLSPRPRTLLENRRRERAPRSYALDLSKAEGTDPLDLCASRGSNHSEGLSDSRGSSPEPPISPRPKGLANHPRILKDKLHNFSLPSRFSKSYSENIW